MAREIAEIPVAAARLLADERLFAGIAARISSAQREGIPGAAGELDPDGLGQGVLVNRGAVESS